MSRVDTPARLAAKAIFLSLSLLSLLVPLQAQETSNRQDLEREIRVIDQLLAETKGRRQRTTAELAMIRQQIDLRERLLMTLSQEILDHEQEIGELDDQICLVQETMDQIRHNYAEAIRATYRYVGSDHIWLSILSSGSLSEAYYRMQFYRQLTRYRERQLASMQKAEKVYVKKQQDLSQAILDKEALWEEKKLEMLRLRDNREVQETVLQVVKNQESKHQEEAEEQRQFLQAALRQTPGAVVPAEAAPAPVQDVGQAFRRSRGELPWPVNDQGSVVVLGFGEQEDVHGNAVRSDGWHIRTSLGEKARSIFEGKVTAIQRVPNGGWVVIMGHGPYRSVYAGLAEVEVRVGQQIAQGQVLGRVQTDERSGETILQFMVYQEPNKFLDPTQWLVE